MDAMTAGRAALGPRSAGLDVWRDCSHRARAVTMCVCAAAACVAALAFVASPAQAAFPGSNGAIAYDVDDMSTGVHIAVVNPNGTGSEVITNVGADQSFDIAPKYSPDGNRILFSRCGGVP